MRTAQQGIGTATGIYCSSAIKITTAIVTVTVRSDKNSPIVTVRRCDHTLQIRREQLHDNLQ